MSTGNKRCDRVNLGAKLLSGEEYGGHAFWDTELFMLPYFAFVFPKTAQNLENYRFHLLDAARENAVKNGFRGAQYPWESADDGTEQCPDWTIESDGNCTRCYVAVYEHHVTVAVAYGIYNYAKITGDQEFLFSKGAEILTETARFWASRYNYIPEKNRFCQLFLCFSGSKTIVFDTCSNRTIEKKIHYLMPPYITLLMVV